MKRLAAACTIAAFALRCTAAGQSIEPPAPLSAPLRARLTEDVIKEAVKQEIAQTKDELPQRDKTVLSGDQYTKFARKFSEAQVPDCVHPDALKFQPHEVVVKSRTFGDWVFGVGSIYAAPFWLAAVARGKCHLLPN